MLEAQRVELEAAKERERQLQRELKSTKSLGLGILLPLEFQLPLACLTPVNVLAKPTNG
jgi:hypothetical protein